MEKDDYPPIENHGVIGNMLTTALIDTTANINFMCWPHFDSPALFCSLLDKNKGGYWNIEPTCKKTKYTSKQSYWPDTNVIQTRFQYPDGVVSIIDYMPIVNKQGLRWLIRKIKGIRGTTGLSMKFKPTFNFGRDKHVMKPVTNGFRVESGESALEFLTEIASQLKEVAPGDNELGPHLECMFTLGENESVVMILKDAIVNDVDHNAEFAQMLKHESNIFKMEEKLFTSTIFYWQSWLDRCTYKGRWREIVERSALVLKLLTFSPTGAIVASPTCSLPEGVGGERNWDYRYTWIRDAAFTIYGLIRIGFTEEAHDFMKWLEARCADAVYDKPDQLPLKIMYSIHGDAKIPEKSLEHLEGYKKSFPVRVGNDAVNQIQMDIFGELLDSIYLSNKYGTLVSYEFWIHIRKLVDYVADNWKIKDEGIWEVRSGKQHFVYSKIMCWVCLDRGLRLSDRRSFPAPRVKWITIRDEIYEEIQNKGYNPEMKAFMQSYESQELDASTLIMSLVFFMAPSDPRNLSTIQRILRPPEEGGLVSNSLVFRYTGEDGLDGNEGTFNICTFWLIEALTRAGKYDKQLLTKARLMFDEMLGYSNHLGLFSEEIALDGSMLGNFPQALTHLSLISAAFNLDRTLSGKSSNS